jgi:tetratricopeptide (TPR) repeat protein
MATPKKTRRWTTVPVSTLHGQETLDQGVVLEEIRTPLGVILWRALRDTLLWSCAAPAARAGLFAQATSRIEKLVPSIQLIATEPALKEAFGGYIRMIQVPQKVTNTGVTTMAGAFRDWAEAEGYIGTALAYAQAAAVADPEDANAAWAAGRLARRRADYYRAKGWFVTAIKRGRDRRQLMDYYRGHVGLAYVAFQRGNLPRAEYYFERAHRAALAHGLSEKVPLSSHDLMWVATERGQYARARGYAEAAARMYPHGHPRLPNFGGDYGYLLLEEGRFADALRVLSAILRCELGTGDRLVYTGNLARAAGGCRDTARFEEAQSAAEELMKKNEAADAEADASLSIARGAAMLGEWDLASRWAQRALEVAKQRREGKIVMMAESFIESTLADRALAAHAAAAACETCAEATERLLTKLPAFASV